MLQKNLCFVSKNRQTPPKYSFRSTQEDKPGLLLPWLTVGAIKSIGISFLSTFTGLFICAMYGLFRPVCLDFLLSQVITHGPSVYVWYVVLR